MNVRSNGTVEYSVKEEGDGRYGTNEEGWDADTLTSYFEDIVNETGAGKLNQNDRAFEVLIHALLGINKQLERLNDTTGTGLNNLYTGLVQ